jgi:GT2 family glycosyltransferase
MPSLSIIIVNYFTSKYLKACLKTLYKHTKGIGFEVVIVDNSMNSDELLKLKKLEKLHRSLTIIANDKNCGFGAANNLGAKRAKGKYLLLLNPDTELVDNSIPKMLKLIKCHKELGALTCLLYQSDQKTLQRAFFGKFQNLASLTIRRYNYQKVDLGREFFYTDIVTGAALMIKKSLFESIGRFDERFFMYLEDDDLCKRISDLGYRNAVLCRAKIIHHEGVSSTKKIRSKHYYQSQKLFFRKHNGALATLALRLIRLPYKYLRPKS